MLLTQPFPTGSPSTGCLCGGSVLSRSRNWRSSDRRAGRSGPPSPEAPRTRSPRRWLTVPGARSPTRRPWRGPTTWRTSSEEFLERVGPELRPLARRGLHLIEEVRADHPERVEALERALGRGDSVPGEPPGPTCPGRGARRHLPGRATVLSGRPRLDDGGPRPVEGSGGSRVPAGSLGLAPGSGRHRGRRGHGLEALAGSRGRLHGSGGGKSGVLNTGVPGGRSLDRPR